MYDGTKEYQFLDHWFRRHISYCMGHKDINRESKIVVSEIFYTFFCILVDLIYKVKVCVSIQRILLMIMVDVW